MKRTSTSNRRQAAENFIRGGEECVLERRKTAALVFGLAVLVWNIPLDLYEVLD